jgi:hypothetical protein
MREGIEREVFHQKAVDSTEMIAALMILRN